MGYLVFANVDENGNITEALAGFNVVPDRQYQYFFYLTEEIDVTKYKIIEHQLVKAK